VSGRASAEGAAASAGRSGEASPAPPSGRSDSEGEADEDADERWEAMGCGTKGKSRCHPAATGAGARRSGLVRVFEEEIESQRLLTALRAHQQVVREFVLECQVRRQA